MSEAPSMSPTVVNEPPRRPHRYDLAVREAACRGLLEDFQRWAGRENADDLQLLTRCAENDGYKFARALERYLLQEPDPELVDILDGFYALVSSAHDQAVRDWVRENAIEVEFTAGERRIHELHGAGVVSQIRAELAEVLFLPDADAERFKGIGGYVYPAGDFASLSKPEPSDG